MLVCYECTPEESGGARLEENSPVTRVAAAARLMNGSRLVAIQWQRKLQTFRLLAQQRQDRGVSLLGQNDIRVFAFDEARKSQSREVRRLRRAPSTFRPFRFPSAATVPMRRIDA